MSGMVQDNKRIAKNTVFLYMRTMAVLFVSLYTSRLVLNVLGETDLGIYNIVGSIVTLMAFLHGAQTKATGRFITYELGKHDAEKRPSYMFSLCLTIHILCAIAVIFIAETFGLYIINEWTSIPEDRMFAANCVYQFSLLTFVVHFVRVPYDAVIIAHENMSVYAYMSILEVILQLGMVLTLQHSSGDNLIRYSFLLFIIAILLNFCYGGYVKWKFKEYAYKWTWEKKESYKILSFSGWTLLGSATNTTTQQGVSILLNNFVGLVANTALGFANQVNTAINKFVNSFTTAFNPQIIKLYAEGNTTLMITLMNRASKFSFILCYVIALPLIVNMGFLLHFWLGTVPEYTVVFCQLIVVCTVIDATTGVFNTAITATGQVKNYQIGISVSFLLDLFCAWLLLMMDIHPALVFGSRIFTRGLVNMFVGFYYSRKLFAFNIARYLREVMLPLLITLLVTIPFVLVSLNLNDQMLRLLSSTLCSIVTCAGCLYVIILNRAERIKVKNYTNRILNAGFKSKL